MFLYYMLDLEIWISHLDAQCLGFIATCNSAAIIVGQYNDRLTLKVRSEDPFAGCKEVVTVGKGKHG
jgi:hypothetical protein